MRTDDVMEMCNKEAYSDKTNIIQTVTTDCLAFMKSEYFKGIIESNKVCIITDPPFNIGYRYNTYKDNKKESEYYGFLKDVFTLYNLPFVVVHYPECLHRISFYTGKFPEKIVSWVYNSNTAKQHRDIAFYGVKPDFRKIKQPYKNPNDKRIRERMKNGAGGGRLYDWWNVNQVKNVSKKQNSHPCVMPVEVMEKIIGILPEEYLIFDPFAGSGTTGVACVKLGNNYIGCDIDEKYSEIAETRIQKELIQKNTNKGV